MENKRFRIGTRCFFILSLIFISACTDNRSSEKTTAADEALSTFQIAEGFKIELVASEPLLGDPVDMEIDEYGRLYVVEMPGYPLDKSGSGKIKILADTNKDGRMDKSTIFAENLILPNSIMRWKKGVIVTDAPHVLYFEDSDNDGRADKRDTLLTGFALSNPQHNLNSPVLGIDNWIYLAHESAVSTETYEKEFGDEGSEVYFPDQPNSPRLGKNSNGRAVRFKPDTRQLEVLSTHTQFGHTFDEWGHHFLVSNADHIIYDVIQENYLKRNPDLPVSDASESISDHGAAAEVFPITENPEHQLLTDIGVITSACGVTAYLGGAFPELYNDDVTFVAEPVSNLIHVDKLKEKGASFTASRIKEHEEFLASTDAKFRPVNMYIGPDGALYVVDYYRQIIEHPEWMGEEVIKSGQLYNDMDKGRIYRISAKDSKAADWTGGLSLGNASNAELVDKLADVNIWWRLNAQRLLIDRKAKDITERLHKMTEHPSPMARLHALWTLEGMGELKNNHIKKALQDNIAGIRENAIKLAERFKQDELLPSLLALSSDPDAKVRYQLLCTLGFFDSAEARTVRQQLLLKDIDDKWVQVAALSATGDYQASLLDFIVQNFQDRDSYKNLIERLAASTALSATKSTIQNLLGKTLQQQRNESITAATLEGLAEGLENRNVNVITERELLMLIETFLEDPAAPVRKASLRLLKINKVNSPSLDNAIERALTIALNKNENDDRRSECIDFLSIKNPEKYRDKLINFLIPEEPLNVQLASLRTLNSIPDTKLSHLLVAQWKTLTPEIQDAAVNTFLSNNQRTKILLDAIDQGKIPAASVSWPRRVHLMAQSDDTLRNRSRAIFTKNTDAEVNKNYQKALTLKGDAEKGEVVFQKNCSICHQVRGKMGIAIGPDLGTIHNWSAEAIMANTLVPNLSISSGFDLWSVELINGTTLQGIIASETPGAITLRNNGMQDKTIKRKDIKSLTALNMSIMPVGLEKQINENEMADLLAFLKKNK